MIKSEYCKIVEDIINGSNLDIVQHYTICLFADKLWSKIEEYKKNEKNERDINTTTN